MTLERADFDYVRDIVRKKSAIVLEPGKEYLVEHRLTSLARREGFASLKDLINAMRAAPSGPLHRDVIEAMTTNETSFFRDIHPFTALRTTVIPKLMQVRAASRELTIWCAATSSGQEPYSILMTLKDAFPALDTWRVRLIATDISREMVERTRAGVYSQLEINRGLPAPMLVKFFEQHGMEWRVKEPLRRLVEVSEMNLSDHWSNLPQVDIVFLRNVLIYFDVDKKKEILGKVRRLLRPEGYLFLGSVETTLNISDAFEKVQVDKTVAYVPKRA